MTEAERDSARPTYPHLDSLERVLVQIPDFLDREVTVTEKIHGFNARVGRDPEGRLWVGTRKQAYDLDDAPSLQGFTDHARAFHEIPTGVTVYGEWAGRGVQKGVDYGEEKRFFVFAERMLDGPVLSSTTTLDQHWLLGAVTVPIIVQGRTTLEVLDELRRMPTIAGVDSPREGVVVAPVEPVLDVYGHQVIAKFKAPQFAERASVRDDRPPMDTTAVDAIAAEYVVAERMRHVLDQVRESTGRDPLDPALTGDVLKAMFGDVVEDSSEVEALSDDDRKKLGKAVNKIAKPLLDEARLEAAREAVAS